MKSLTFVSLALLLASCGQQDPLAGQPDYIRNATPGFEKPGPPVASRDNMIITANSNHFFFTEGVEGQTTLTGRILLDNYDAELSIDNLADFTGATFDPKSGLFTWKPTTGVVAGIDSTTTTVLRVRLNGLQRATNITATRTEDFPVTISRLEHQPTIVKEAGFPNSAIREGDSLRLTIYVKDTDAVKVVGSMPRILITTTPSGSKIGDLSPYVHAVSDDTPEQDFTDPTVWKFTLNVSLQDADLTKNVGDFYFRVTTLSHYGKFSIPKDYKISVLTSVSTPIVSADSFETASGSTSTNDVLIIDPRQEGIMSVEVTNPYDLPTGFTVVCTYPPTTLWMAKCRAKYALAGSPMQPMDVGSNNVVAPAPNAGVVVGPNMGGGGGTPIVIGPNPTTPRDVTVQLKATNRSPVSYDKMVTVKNFTLNFKVVSP